MERLERIATINELLDIYGSLLTQRQRDALAACYQEDLSLSEIAGITGGTRQAAHDLIHRGEMQLFHYEEQLQIHSNQQKRQAAGEELAQLLSPLPLSPAQAARLEELLSILTT